MTNKTTFVVERFEPEFGSLKVQGVWSDRAKAVEHIYTELNSEKAALESDVGNARLEIFEEPDNENNQTYYSLSTTIAYEYDIVGFYLTEVPYYE